MSDAKCICWASGMPPFADDACPVHGRGPVEPEANATIVDLRAKVAYWKEHSGAHQERAEGWKNAEEIAIRERDAAIERAESMLTRLRKAIGGDIDWTTGDCLDVFRDRLAKLAAVTAERDALQDEREPERLEVFRLRTAARAMLDTFEYRERHTLDETAWERFETARCLLRDVIDPTKPAEHPGGFDISAEETPAEPKRCTCVEHAEYGAMVDCPVHGVERAKRPPACSVCNDTHTMQLRERDVPCTACPVPRENCRANGSGAYCREPSCDCGCHENLATEVPGESAGPGCPKCGSTNPRHRHDAPFVVSAAEITPPAVDPRDARIGSLDSDPFCDALAAELREFKNDPHASAAVRYLEAIKRRNARIAELQHLLRVEQGCSGASRASARHAELEADRDQQRARADAAEARCEAGLPLLFTGAKETGK